MADLTSRHRSDSAWWFVFFLLYTSLFWGNLPSLAGSYSWSHAFYALLGPAWESGTAAWLTRGDAIALFLCAEAYLLAFLLPILVLRRCDRTATDAGLGAPKPGRAWVATLIALPSVPIGIWLGLSDGSPWGTPLVEGLELAAMLPEHFLIFGLAMRLMHLEARMGSLDPVAIIGATAIFAAAHGGTSMAELVLSVPVGAMFSLSTAWAGSIWPALAMHWLLNIIGMTVTAIVAAMPTQIGLAGGPVW